MKLINYYLIKFKFIFVLGILIANFHAATWPLMFVLFMPYIASGIITEFSCEKIYIMLKKHSEKKLKKVPENSDKYIKISEDIDIYNKIIKKYAEKKSYKIVKRKNYNLRNLILLMLIVIISGFITPIHDVPFTYIIKSMFGYSNFKSGKSMIHISEMQPIIPASSVSFLVFMVVLVEFLLFLPSKIKLEHGFLILGLIIMTLVSNRYLALLVFLGSFVIIDLITQCFKLYVSESIEPVEELLIKPSVAFFLIICVTIYTISSITKTLDVSFVDEKRYPTKATEYILNNIDYKNMRIYNSYNFGSYLMLNNIPVFIDSRLDVYCSEFNDTDIFHNYIDIVNDEVYYEDIFSKYDFTHILLKNDEVILKYLKRDSNYSILYEDKYFTLFSRNNANV